MIGRRGRNGEQGSFYVDPLGLGDVLVFLKNGLNGRWLFQSRGDRAEKGNGAECHLIKGVGRRIALFNYNDLRKNRALTKRHSGLTP